jgi:hypothetical protein
VGVPLGSVSLIVGAVGLIAEKSFAPYAIAGAIVLFLVWPAGTAAGSAAHPPISTKDLSGPAFSNG